MGIRHSEILVSTIKDILEKVSWSLKDIELICVGLGPGSFTGLRIAVSTVKGLALVIGCKVVGVATMDAMVMIKATYSRKGRLNLIRIWLLITHAIVAVKVITNVVAIPICRAVSTLLDTPRKGQIPRKSVRTKLFVIAAARKINMSSIRNLFLSH